MQVLDHTKISAEKCVVMQLIPTSFFCLLEYGSTVAGNDNRSFKPSIL